MSVSEEDVREIWNCRCKGGAKRPRPDTLMDLVPVEIHVPLGSWRVQRRNKIFLDLFYLHPTLPKLAYDSANMESCDCCGKENAYPSKFGEHIDACPACYFRKRFDYVLPGDFVRLWAKPLRNFLDEQRLESVRENNGV